MILIGFDRIISQVTSLAYGVEQVPGLRAPARVQITDRHTHGVVVIVVPGFALASCVGNRTHVRTETLPADANETHVEPVIGAEHRARGGHTGNPACGEARRQCTTRREGALFQKGPAGCRGGGLSGVFRDGHGIFADGEVSCAVK